MIYNDTSVEQDCSLPASNVVLTKSPRNWLYWVSKEENKKNRQTGSTGNALLQDINEVCISMLHFTTEILSSNSEICEEIRTVQKLQWPMTTTFPNLSSTPVLQVLHGFSWLLHMYHSEEGSSNYLSSAKKKEKEDEWGLTLKFFTLDYRNLFRHFKSASAPMWNATVH